MQRFLLLLIASIAICLPLTLVAPAQDKKVETPIRSDQKDAFGDPLPAGAIARIGTTRYRLSDSHLPQSATLSPDGKLLLILRLPDEIEIWKLPVWKLHRVIKCQIFQGDSQLVDRNRVFSADSKKLVMFDAALQQVQFFDVDSGKLVKQIDLSKERTKSDDFPRLKLSNDQQTLIITNNIIGPVGRDQIGVWDMAKNKMVQSFYVMRSRVDQGVVISADCRWMAQNTAEYAASHFQEDGTYAVRVFELLSGKSIRSFDTGIPMEKLVFSPDGKWLATSYGSHLRIFDDAGKERHNIRMKTSMLPMDFSPDGKFLYLADYTGNIQKWNPVSGERMASYPAPYHCSITQLAFQPDGKVMALGISAFAIHFWDITADKVIAPTGIPASVISDLTFLPHGELLVASEEGMIAAWNPRTGAKLRDLQMESSRPDNFVDHQYYGVSMDGKHRRRDGSSFRFSRCGGFLANYNHLHELKTGKLLWPGQSDFPFGPVLEAGAMSFLDAGSNIASVLQKKVRLWDIFTGRDVLNFDLPLRAFGNNEVM